MKPAALLLLALISLLPMTARANELSDAAQPPSADELKSRRDNAIRDIGAAAKDLDAARPEAALATLRHVREDLEDDGDPHLLRLTYDAMAIAGNELGDRAAELAGHFQGVLLHHLLRQDDALETALAELSLADAYQRYGLREPQYIALSNAQMSLSSARASKANSKDVEAAEGMYQSMIGQILWQNERIELALVHFRKARALARKGRIDPQNAGRIDQLIAEGERRMAGLQRTRATGVAQCTGGPHLQDIQERACRLEADHQIAEGSAAQAERILVSLLTDVSQGSLRPDRYEAARDLLLLRRAIHPPDHGDVIAISDLVANYLASKNQLAGASLIAARLADIAPLGDADRTRIAALCGHVARRAIRNGSEELARRFLEWQRKVVLIGLADPDRPLVDPLTDEADRLMTASLLRIESARIAELNGHDRLAAALRQKVEAQIATIPLRHFDAIERRLLYRYVKEDEYVFPTFAAAEEFMGRLGSRLPKSDERHDAAIQTWISFVGGWWSDVPRSIKMIEALIADIRSEPEGRTRALARSLEMLEQALDPSARRSRSIEPCRTVRHRRFDFCSISPTNRTTFSLPMHSWKMRRRCGRTMAFLISRRSFGWT
jgi:hypothetical protein